MARLGVFCGLKYSHLVCISGSLDCFQGGNMIDEICHKIGIPANANCRDKFPHPPGFTKGADQRD